VGTVVQLEGGIVDRPVPKTAGKPKADRGRPVARLVTPVLFRFGVLVVVIALVAIVGLVLSFRAVSHVSDDVQPAADANAAVLQDLTEMNAAVSTWALSGRSSAVDDYGQAERRLPADQQKVRQFAEDDAELDLLVTRLEERTRAWRDAYAEPRIAAKGGPGTFNPQRFRLGQDLFSKLEAAHQETQLAFDTRVREGNEEATLMFRGTIVAVALLALAAWYLIGRSRTHLLSEISEPLRALETAVQKMTRTDLDVRTEARGPKEVRSVAIALNGYADAQGRARAVEGRIQNELRVLDTAKDDFVSNVSHELRTPLTTISGYLEMVADEFDGQLQPRHERMLEATRRNVSRLKALIDDLLALSKAESRSTDLEAGDVTSMVRDAVTDVRITGARRGIRIDVSAPAEPMVVLSDRAMLQRALINVLSNAVKFSHDDGQVDVRVTKLEHQVEIAIQDHGIGIPRIELDRLGTRFFRASNAVTNEIAGTGLGLRIVQTIIDKHAGDVMIESTEGQGTTVFIRLRLHGYGGLRVAEDPEEQSGN
jgi:two-component system OmpR family sensor kinase